MFGCKCEIYFISIVDFNFSAQDKSLSCRSVSVFFVLLNKIYDYFTFLQSLKKFSRNTFLVVYSWSNIWAKNNATSSAVTLNFTFLPAHRQSTSTNLTSYEKKKLKTYTFGSSDQNQRCNNNHLSSSRVLSDDFTKVQSQTRTKIYIQPHN